MKTRQINFIYIIALLAIIYSSCKSKRTAQEITTQNLVGTWVLESATIDGVATNLFDGMRLTFYSDPNKVYFTEGGGLVWSAEGTWEFVDEAGLLLMRNDQIALNIMELSPVGSVPRTLTLSLDWDSTTFGEGRVSSVSGLHIFSFRGE